jgi:hypothetical protein
MDESALHQDEEKRDIDAAQSSRDPILKALSSIAQVLSGQSGRATTLSAVLEILERDFGMKPVYVLTGCPPGVSELSRWKDSLRKVLKQCILTVPSRPSCEGNLQVVHKA